MRTAKGYLFRIAITRESAPSLVFGRDSKAGRGVGRICRGRREGFRCALIGGCWHRTLGARYLEQGILCAWLGELFSFL